MGVENGMFGSEIRSGFEGPGDNPPPPPTQILRSFGTPPDSTLTPHARAPQVGKGLFGCPSTNF